jgi:hypothetical protein
MSKNKKLLLLGITLVIAGFFIIIFFSSEEEEYKVPLTVDSVRFSEDPANYEFEEKGDVTLVTNNNLGFSFEVPSEWRYEEYYEFYGLDTEGEKNKGLNFFSPEYLIDENKKSITSLVKGCSVNVHVIEECYEYEDGTEFCATDDLRTTIEMIIDEEIAIEGESVIEVDNLNGHRINYVNENSGIEHIEIPIEKKIYEITGYFSGEDIGRCQEKFHKLLDSISFTEKND